MSAENRIHPLAVIEPGATLGSNVTVGPFCLVGPEVTLEDGVELVSHVSVSGATTIGAGTRVHAHSALGGPPQDLKHKGGRTTLTIGRNCLIREGVTMSLGSDCSTGATIVGDNCNFFAQAHVGHDCVVGNRVTMINGSALGGHCVIEDNVTIGGLTAVHQFVRVGKAAFLGGCSAVARDVIPYALAQGNLAKLKGLNIIGLRRAGLSRQDIGQMRAAYALLFSRDAPITANLEKVKQEFGGLSTVDTIIAFLEGSTKRHLVVPEAAKGSGEDGNREAD